MATGVVDAGGMAPLFAYLLTPGGGVVVVTVEVLCYRVSLPRLTDFDWRVDTKTSSDSVARMAVPTCILNLQIEERPDQVNQTPSASNVNVELSKETLETMLDGLGKIRDQLASVANR